MNTGRTLASLLLLSWDALGLNLLWDCRTCREKNQVLFVLPTNYRRCRKKIKFFCSAYTLQNMRKKSFIWVLLHTLQNVQETKLRFFGLLTQPCSSVRAWKDKLLQNHTGYKRQAQKELIRLCLGSCCSDQVLCQSLFLTSFSWEGRLLVLLGTQFGAWWFSHPAVMFFPFTPHIVSFKMERGEKKEM
jgi:hypothetical protein